MRTIEQTLTLWAAGFLSHGEVVAWADREIARLDAPPYPLIQLAFDGPEACAGAPHPEPPFDVPPMPFDDLFAWRVVTLDVEDSAALTAFAHWLCRAWIGEEDVDPAFFRLAAEVDHLIDDCGNLPAALERLRRDLPALTQRCRQLAAAYGED